MFNIFCLTVLNTVEKKWSPYDTISLKNKAKQKTGNLLTTIDLSSDDILKKIKNPDLSKSHGHNIINASMVKIYDDSICKPFKLIFRFCLESEIFPIEWKTTNVVPLHEMSKYYKATQPIPLLSIIEKILERLYDRMFEVFLQKITWYETINQVLDQLILALINFILSPMKFANLLMIILKSELFRHT